MPTETPGGRECYADFRHFLLEDGFVMIQYSVYMRHSASDENTNVYVQRVKAKLPSDGEVRIVKITDKLFGKIEVFYGAKKKRLKRHLSN